MGFKISEKIYKFAKKDRHPSAGDLFCPQDKIVIVRFGKLIYVMSNFINNPNSYV